MIVGGVRRPEQAFNQTTYGLIAPTLNFVGPCVFLLLQTYYACLKPTHPTEDLNGVLFISGTAAIVLVGIGLWYTKFWLRSHPDYYEDEAPDWVGGDPSVAAFKTVLLAWIFLILMVFLSGNIYEILHLKEPRFKNTFALFFSLGIKLGIFVEPLKQAWNGQMDRALQWTLGVSIHMVLFIGPILVITSWILHVPITLRVDWVIPLCCALGSGLVWFLLSDGKSSRLKGFMLIIPYMLMTFAYALYVGISTKGGLKTIYKAI
jgi:Ca2+:H+ antiporter